MAFNWPDPISDFIDRALEPAQKLLGFSNDITKSAVIFTFTFVFALLWMKVPAGKPRHIFSLISGVAQMIFNFGIYPSLYYSLMVITAYPLVSAEVGQKHPFYVFFYVMIWLLASTLYYYKFYYAVWQMDITSPLMIAVQKVSSLAWNIYDGRKQDEARAKNGGKDPEVPVLHSSYQRRMAISECPSFFHYLCYIFFPINIFYGPATEYKMYENSVLRTEPLLRCRIRLFLQQLVIGVGAMVYFTHPTDLSYMGTKEFMAKPLLWRITWVEIMMHWTRLKYYSAWCLTAAAMILSGAGYDGKSWENAINIFFFRLQFARRPRVFIANWNCGTQRFLKYYIYIRGPTSKRTGAVHPAMQYVTFIVSAIWHGWYIGYYVHFSILFLLNVIDRTYYKVFPIKNEIQDPFYGMVETEREKKEKKEKEEKKKESSGKGKEKGKDKTPSPSQSPADPSLPSAPPTPSSSSSSSSSSFSSGVDETWLQRQINKMHTFYHPLKWICGKDWMRAIIEWVLTQYLFNYAAMTMVALTGPRTWMCNNAVRWWGVVFSVVVISFSVIYDNITHKSRKMKEQARKQ